MDGGNDRTPTELPVDDETGFRIKGAASTSQPAARGKQQKNDGEREPCTICLDPISERAVAVPCNHLTFDFLCLISWLQERSSCPLCNTTVTEVQYDFRSPEDYKRYHVPKSDPDKHDQYLYERVRRRRGQGFIQRRSHQRPQFPQQAAGTSGEDPALERRRRVYRDKSYSFHVGANRISQHRDFTPSDFTSSPELQSRARMFLRRELKVFTFLDTAVAPRGGNREFLLEYVVAILKSNELKGANGHAEDLLADYLGRENCRLLLHELEAWLRSPYTALDAWDRHVQYADSSASTSSKATGS